MGGPYNKNNGILGSILASPISKETTISASPSAYYRTKQSEAMLFPSFQALQAKILHDNNPR